MYVRREAVLSSQIEGTQSSLARRARDEAHLLDPTIPSDVTEVVNYVDAMNYGLARLTDLPVSVRLIREIHERLMRNARGGSSRPATCGLAELDRPGGLRVARRQLRSAPAARVFQRARRSRALPPCATLRCPRLVQVGLAHAQFETIHPFLDGNGRVGRLLITFLLTERRLLAQPVLYLSHYFKRHRSAYYDVSKPCATRATGKAGLASSSTAWPGQPRGDRDRRRHLAMREEHRRRIIEEFGRATANGLRIMEGLFVNPLVTVDTVRQWLGVTTTGANKLVNRLVEIGLLREITGHGRNRRFRFDPILGCSRTQRRTTRDASIPQFSLMAKSVDVCQARPRGILSSNGGDIRMT